MWNLLSESNPPRLPTDPDDMVVIGRGDERPEEFKGHSTDGDYEVFFFLFLVVLFILSETKFIDIFLYSQ